ncbi:GNAT family N-acetyltransferase [Aquincola sp. MAHUQ-54]|uniref:GNAT family N-acetyltransferase n=1 Tax=Aquincola agrisoli TaxID=3119538 RepID=A0AAW9Q7D4_9BURK
MDTPLCRHGITQTTIDDYPALLRVWEACIRPRHPRISQAESAMYRELITSAFLPSNVVRAYRSPAGQVLGFVAVEGRRIGMLFVAPAYQGQGVGAQLCRHAQDVLGATGADVHEDNEAALAFFRRMGLEEAGTADIGRDGGRCVLVQFRVPSAPWTRPGWPELPASRAAVVAAHAV